MSKKIKFASESYVKNNTPVSDWNSAGDVIGYIKNRTHWVEQVYEPIKLDGIQLKSNDCIDISALGYEYNLFAYKISDNFMTADELSESTMSIKVYNIQKTTQIDTKDVQDVSAHLGLPANSIVMAHFDTMIFVPSYGGTEDFAYGQIFSVNFAGDFSDTLGLIIPSKGTYIQIRGVIVDNYEESNVTDIELLTLQKSKYNKLNSNYLPDSLQALVQNEPDINVKWNGVIDDKLAIDMSILGYEGATLVKVSDIIISQKYYTNYHCLNSTVYFSDGGIHHLDTADKINLNTPGAIILDEGTVVSVYDAQLLCESLNLPENTIETGLYFLTNQYYFTSQFSSPLYERKQLNENLMPESYSALQNDLKTAQEVLKTTLNITSPSLKKWSGYTCSYLNGKFVAVNGSTQRESTDIIHWEEHPCSYHNIVCDKSYFYALDSKNYDYLVYSKDGNGWSRIPGHNPIIKDLLCSQSNSSVLVYSKHSSTFGILKNGQLNNYSLQDAAFPLYKVFTYGKDDFACIDKDNEFFIIDGLDGSITNKKSITIDDMEYGALEDICDDLLVYQYGVMDMGGNIIHDLRESLKQHDDYLSSMMKIGQEYILFTRLGGYVPRYWGNYTDLSFNINIIDPVGYVYNNNTKIIISIPCWDNSRYGFATLALFFTDNQGIHYSYDNGKTWYNDYITTNNDATILNIPYFVKNYIEPHLDLQPAKQFIKETLEQILLEEVW